MSLLTQYQDLMSAKRTLEGRLISIAESQYALDREAYYTVFPEEKGQKYTKAPRHFCFKVSDFRISDEGKCELWEEGRCGEPDEVMHEYDIDLTLENATDYELLRMAEPKTWTAYKNARIAVYQAVAAKRHDEKMADLRRQHESLKARQAELEAQLAALPII
jgi:hypothetical protein